MNILVTGAKGFIGKNLIYELKNRGYTRIFEYDVDSGAEMLDEYCKEAGFVFHLAGINRPKDASEFMPGNCGVLSELLENLKKHGNTCSVLLSSSIQAGLENPYGESKKAAEDLLASYGKQTGKEMYVFRLPNVFGKWCRPNYNSAVATFCHNIAHDLPIVVNEENPMLSLVYIDDVVNAFINAVDGKVLKHERGFCIVPGMSHIRLKDVAELIKSFKDSRNDLSIPDMSDAFTKKLYATYLSYLPQDKFSYPLKMNSDDRGSFTEILRTANAGQFSVNVTKPGITKGNHRHNTKNEKFVVVSGKGVIRFRKIDCDEVIEYPVSGEKIEVVDIPPGYTHNIENTGECDLVTFMWCSECFDPEHPDTYYVDV